MALTKVSYSMITGAVANVMDFGALGNGITDDTVAIQAALDSIGNLGTVFFPKGNYRILNTLNIIYTESWHAVNMLGVGSASNLVWEGGSGRSMIHYRGVSGAGWYAKTYIEKLQLYGNAFTAGLYTNVHGIQVGNTPQNVFSGVGNFTIRDCLIRHFTIGIAVYYESDEFLIENNYIERFTGYGIYNLQGGSGVWVTRNHISDGGASSVGVYTSLSSSTVEQNIIQGGLISIGIQVAGLGDFRGKAVSIRNNYLESQIAGDYAIALFGTDTAIIENNTMNGFGGATLILLDNDADAVPCKNIVLGVNRHTQSGGFITALASANAASVNCKITGLQQTDGAITTITGPFQNISTLNDYTPTGFIPTLFFGATQQTVIVTASVTKIGRVVYINGSVLMNAAVAGTGTATIRGLPYPTSEFAAFGGVIALSTSGVTNTGAVSALTDISTSQMTLYSVATSGVRSALTQANFTSVSEVSFSGFYLVS